MNGKCVSWRLKLRQKNILYFYSRGLRLPKSSFWRLVRTNKKVGIMLRLTFRTKIRVLQIINLLDYNCLTSIFFKPHFSLFEGSNCFLRFILDPPLIRFYLGRTQPSSSNTLIHKGHIFIQSSTIQYQNSTSKGSRYFIRYERRTYVEMLTSIRRG